MRPYYEENGITIYHGDCREILPSLSKVDLVLTDPPYGINYKPQRSQGNCKKWQSQRPFGSVVNDGLPFDPALLLGYSRLILWGGNHYASRLPDSGGWLVWDKKRGASQSRGFISSDAELAWTNIGGTVRLFPFMWNGLCRDAEIGEHYHPTQKPRALMKWCIQIAGDDMDTIVDPFMGSGTTLRAAKDLGRKAIGIEIEEKYCEVAANRLRQEVLNFNSVA